MEIIKIIGVAILAVVIIIIIKQYKPEFAIYISIITSIIIVYFVIDKFSGIINLLNNLSNKLNSGQEFLKILMKLNAIELLNWRRKQNYLIKS